ncbi:MAG TPA: autotransporter-associated beta strand repeat-containing protein [Chthoniobacteraceae bacterium]|jgi:autotransporter-associated beta strand protein|nr:autotransporter-associated beta strand repeat-containing protein [Chthoniobacteraceae bacterium]
MCDPSIPRFALRSLFFVAAALLYLNTSPSLHAQGTNTNTTYVSNDGELDLTDTSDYTIPINPQDADTTDVLLWGPYASGTSFTAEGETLNFGTLDEGNTSPALVLTDGTISLNSANNSLAPVSDILYTSSAGMIIDTGIIANTSGNFDTVGTTTMNGILSGTGNITVTGSGTFILNAANLETGTITAGPGTLVLNGTATFGAAGLGLANGGTAELLSDVSATYSTKTVSIANSGSYTLDLDPLTSSSGQTITLSGGLTAAANLSGTLNVVSHNGYSLALGTVSLPSNTGGPYAFTFNPGVPLSISSIAGGSYGSTLIFQGGNTITVNGMSSSSNGYLSLNLSGTTTLVLAGTTTLANTNNSPVFNWTLSGGTLDINSSGALGFHNNGNEVPTIYLAGGNIDNTSGAAVNINNGSGAPANAWYASNDFSFGGSNALNIGTGTFYLSGTSAGVATRTITTNGGGALTIGGPVVSGSSSAAGLTKAGSGTLVLGGDNTFTGPTIVNAGTLQIGNGTTQSSSNSSGVAVAAGATLQFDESSGANYAVTISSSGAVIGLEGSGITNTLSGILSGAGGFTQAGAGTTVLAASETLTGPVSVNAGTLQIGNGTTGSIPAGVQPVTGGTLAFNEANGSTIGYGITDNGAVKGAESAGNINTISGVISGTGNFTQSGAGTTILAAGNTYSGTTTVSGGALQINGGAALSGSSIVNLGAGTLALRSDSNDTFNTAGVNITASTSDIDVNQLSAGGNNTLTLAGAVNFNNGITLNVTGGNGDTLALGAVNTDSATINASTAGVNIGTYTVGDGNYGVTLQGSEPITIGTFAGTNDYRNSVLFDLALKTNTAIGTLIFYSNATGYALNVDSGSSTIGSLEEGIPANEYGAMNINVNGGSLALNGPAVIDEVHSTSYWSLTSGTLALNNNASTGDGYVAMSVYGGVLDNTSGSPVTLSANNGWTADGDFTFGGSNALNIGTGGFTLSGTTGVVTRTITTSGTAPFTIGGKLSPGASTGVALAKAGSGTLILSANSTSTFTGATTVLAGTLIVTGSISGGAVTVGDPANPATVATLEGTGLVGPLTVGASASNTGANLDPGNVAGAATGDLTAASLTFSGSAAGLDIQLGGTNSGNPVAGANYNFVTTTGSLALNGANLSLALQSNFAGSGDNLYFIIDNTSSQAGGAASLGEFSYQGALLGQGAIFFVGQQEFAVSYDANLASQAFAGTGNDVALEAIPEGSSCNLALAGIAILCLLQTRKQTRRS